MGEGRGEGERRPLHPHPVLAPRSTGGIALPPGCAGVERCSTNYPLAPLREKEPANEARRGSCSCIAWGRPADVLVMPDVALLVFDDYAGVIYRIAYRKP